MLSRILAQLHLARAPCAHRAEDRLDRAAADLEASSAEIRKVALDHAESTDHVNTTIRSLLDRMQRRELREDEAAPR